MATSHSQFDPSPPATVMQMVMGAWVSQTISAVTRLDVPDLLQQHGPLTARQLTENYGVKARPEFLERVLRACASVGLFTEDAGGRFGPTPLSEALTLNSPLSVKRFAELFGGSWWKVWTGLPDTLRTGQPQAKAQLGTEYWDYYRANPKEMEDFSEAMKSRQDAMRGLLEYCDFSWARTVVDVGGGFGHLAIGLLHRYSHLRACVVDLPDLIPMAKRHASHEDQEVLARLSFVGQDMFADVPPGDVYILSGIIHDWDDLHCIRLLQNCRARMQRDSRIYCLDAISPPMGDTSSPAAKFLDVHMMVIGSGRERTEAQWQSLYDEAGLEIASITPLQYTDSNICIVEGIKRYGWIADSVY